jgi:hypothetical protein
MRTLLLCLLALVADGSPSEPGIAATGVHSPADGGLPALTPLL